MNFKNVTIIVAGLLLTCLVTNSVADNVEQQQGPMLQTIYVSGSIDVEKVEQILQLASNPQVVGVLFVVDISVECCGACEILYREITALSAIKPVVTFIAGSCVRGAYLAFMGSTWIVAPTSAIVGGIGIMRFIERYKDYQVVAQKSFVNNIEIFSAGKYKGIYSPYAMPLTQEDRDALQAIVDARYALFVQAVAKQRQLSIELAPDWADGKQFCGFEACEKKLIDQVGGYSDAVQKLTELM